MQTYDRYQLVDFAYPNVYTEVFIISAKRANRPLGYIFKGIYDEQSYILLLISFVLMIMILWSSFALSAQRQVSIGSIAIHFFGSIWGQPFPENIIPRGCIRAQTTLYLFGFWNFFIITMYGSLVISKMTLSSEPSSIDTLGDLVAQTDLKAYILKHSFVEDALDSFGALQDMMRDDRIEFLVNEDFSNSVIFNNLQDRSHVLIDTPLNFNFYRTKLKDVTDFCRHDPTTKYHFSKQSLFGSHGGWLYRKNFPKSGTINMYLMWLEAFGFNKDVKKNAGVFSSKKMEEDCESYAEEAKISCRNFPDDRPVSHSRLSLFHLHAVFKYFGIGLGMATLVFLTELFLISNFHAIHNSKNARKLHVKNSNVNYRFCR